MSKIFFILSLTLMTLKFEHTSQTTISKVTPVDEGRYYFQNSLLIPKNKKTKVTWSIVLKRSFQV